MEDRFVWGGEEEMSPEDEYTLRKINEAHKGKMYRCCSELMSTMKYIRAHKHELTDEERDALVEPFRDYEFEKFIRKD